MNFTATCVPSELCVPSQTAPIPPRPSRRVSLYFPATNPCGADNSLFCTTIARVAVFRLTCQNHVPLCAGKTDEVLRAENGKTCVTFPHGAELSALRRYPNARGRTARGPPPPAPGPSAPIAREFSVRVRRAV